ncbi:ER lumen protein retaining receptor-like [Tripterygium wilfordii]|uniref:ER lumen protein-retaining receptor n=1 Tax=Tripterygium wilfordii TaxID=458696 RepID=A0A7J7CWM9_TRIWF|nr:ER lumen protein retaining receptor-like [Tripterygium wilfordii]
MAEQQQQQQLMIVVSSLFIAIIGGALVSSVEGNWCVARSDASNQALQGALDYACESGADCTPIQPNGLCSLPNTIQAHASYAYNSFFQRKAMAPGSCDFSGTATVAKTDPSYGSCVYPSSARLAGDMTHLASVLVLLLKIHTIKSCAGVSLKTQELYALVFATRYLDIFTNFISFYNIMMKLIFLGSSFSIVWYIRRHKIVRRSYDRDQDTFRHFFLILPCLFLALLINERFTFKEVMWTFSLYLEAVAILPQLVLLQRTRNIDNLTGQYVFLLGAYRALYILNWIYRYFTEEHYVHWITWIAGLVQTLLYADFFYYYFQSWKNNVKLQLPA